MIHSQARGGARPLVDRKQPFNNQNKALKSELCPVCCSTLQHNRTLKKKRERKISKMIIITVVFNYFKVGVL